MAKNIRTFDFTTENAAFSGKVLNLRIFVDFFDSELTTGTEQFCNIQHRIGVCILTFFMRSILILISFKKSLGNYKASFRQCSLIRLKILCSFYRTCCGDFVTKRVI